MTKSIFTIVILSFLLSETLNAQNIEVNGKVVDAETGEGLPFANVFINRTTHGVATDQDGFFKLQLTVGQIELVVTHVGYKPFMQRYSITTSQDIGIIKVSPDNQQLDEIEVKAKKDKEWEKYLVKFESTLLGSYGGSKQCSIQNPWVLNFVKGDKDIQVTASAPLKISNKYLGYEMWFYLSPSSLTQLGYSITGNIYFHEMRSGSEKELYTWANNRRQEYLLSSRHLFKSLVNDQLKGNEFYLYTDNPGGKEANTYLESTNNFRKALGNTIVTYDTIGMYSKQNDGIYRVAINGRLEIHYHGARSIRRAYEDIGYPVSWMATRQSFLLVDESGLVLNPENLITSGDMNESWLARMLPQDYEPPVNFHNPKIDREIEEQREFLYIHTDKPYYLQGEPVWFKVYVDYFNNELRDSLSRVLYVELISPEGKIEKTKILPINNGFSYGDLVVADSAKSGMYALRAYTNLMRNFGDSSLYIKPVPILRITEKPDPSIHVVQPNTSNALSIATNKEKYSTREEIKVTVATQDNSGKPHSAHLSVSVTDSKQVITVNEDNIVEAYLRRGNSGQVTKADQFPLETGVSFQGTVENEKSKKLQASIKMVDWTSRDMFQFDTDRGGNFYVTGLDYFGKREFIFEAFNRKNKSIGRVKIIPQQPPAPITPFSDFPWPVLETENPQRIISSFEVPAGTKMLEEVIIKDGRINMPQFKSTYGRADFVLEEKDINKSYESIIYSIYKILPNGMVQRSGNLSAQNQAEMLVTINDARFLVTQPRP